MRTLAIGFAALAWVWLTTMSAGAAVSVEIVNFGTFTARMTSFKDNPNDPTGRVGVADDIHLVEQTDRLCARLGVQFGIRFKLVAPSSTGVVPLRIVTRFPPEGIVNAKGRRFADIESTQILLPGAETVELYGFDEPFELVAGVWRFEIHHAGRKVAEQRFTVATHCGIS